MKCEGEVQAKGFDGMQTLDLLKEKEAAEFLGFTKGWLAKLRHFGGGPKYLKLGGAIRYKREDLEDWVDANTFENTSQEKGAR